MHLAPNQKTTKKEKFEQIAEGRDLQPATLARVALLEFIERHENEITKPRQRLEAAG
jgi:predicted transcriptional regulator